MISTLDQCTRFVLAEGAPLVANLGALWAADPAFAMELEERLDEEPYPTMAAKSGMSPWQFPPVAGRFFCTAGIGRSMRRSGWSIRLI